jgi:hypothetical protein
LIVRAEYWKSNAEVIVAANQLGYITDDDFVLDATFGIGVWWKVYRPPALITNSLLETIESDFHYDFRKFPDHWKDLFNVVAYDPPYKLNGKPSEADIRYGVDVRATWEERYELIEQGIVGCSEIVAPDGRLFLKCMDQVCLFEVRWQTKDFANFAEKHGFVLEDRLDRLRKPRVQPVKNKDGSKRTQRHAQANSSSLLILKKVA